MGEIEQKGTLNNRKILEMISSNNIYNLSLQNDLQSFIK